MDAVKYLTEALNRADAFRGQCAPNPAVGAVAVKDGKVVGAAAHPGAGSPHAETLALQEAGERARGCVLYVTLEPCCHWGKTPPCTELVKSMGVAKVVYGLEDPNPAVSGKGATALRESGIEVHHHPLDAIDAFYESYRYWHRTGLPFVTVKLALSLDGKIAGPHGEPVAITGPELKQFTHQHRLRTDAILTTHKTLAHDNPQLNARLGDTITAKRIFVIDRHLHLPKGMRILDTAESITVFCDENCGEMQMGEVDAMGMRPVPVPADDDGLSLRRVVEFIGKTGCHDLWVEAGGKCFQGLLEAGVVNRAYVYLGTRWLGQSAQLAFQDGMGKMMEKAQVKGWTPFGRDALCELHWEARV